MFYKDIEKWTNGVLIREYDLLVASANRPSNPEKAIDKALLEQVTDEMKRRNLTPEKETN